jgi:formate-dependent nitrite reductase cytochrome c552 subunit
MQQFIEDTQSGVLERLRMTKAEAAIEPNTPDWVATVLEFISRDGSLGVHNFAYTSTLLDAAEVELGITIGDVPSTIPVAEIEDPLDCAECHMDAYRRWQTSPHANASLSQEFQALFAEDGRPSYCMGCHASGYDSRAENYVFEGVVCSNCHYKLIEAEHPPGPMEVANDSDVCGRCHSGQHAPTYDEWLVSSHSTVGIDCADCHTAHDNGLKEGDVNSTCGTCHEEAVVDEIHMGEEMTCVDCHMTRRTHENGIRVFQTGHSMGIDPGTCAECHGNTHLLSSGNTMLLDQQVDQLEVLEDEVAALQETATENLNSGVVGGAIGALVMVGIAFLIVRLGRLR